MTLRQPPDPTTIRVRFPLSVSLVIPGRNCSRTITACLSAVTPLLARGELAEIIFVDDGSTDDTARKVAEFPEVKLISGQGGGAGAARNLGWRAATSDLVWFIDSDTVAEPDALMRLLPHLEQEQVVAAGGSYGNMCPDSLVASLIHEEIIQRHRRMPHDVNFLSTYNVIYRRDALETVGGFDETRYNGPGIAGAEDTELAYRLTACGFRLRFEPRSLVRHFHLTRLAPYFRVQQRHGFYRVRLYLDYPGRTSGDSYSNSLDHIQPILAMLILAAAALTLWQPLGSISLALCVMLLACQIPMTIQIIARTHQWRFLAYVPFGFLRAFRRGFGLIAGVMDAVWGSLERAYATRMIQPRKTH